MNKQEYPLASFCIVAYKAEKFIEETLDAAFAQDYPNLEIVISDDGSPDRTFEIIQQKVAAYHGPHKIILNRNDPNLGPRENYNKVLYELSHGEYLIFADGDDISRADRTSICVNLMQQHPDVMSMSVTSQCVDENGNDLPVPIWNKWSRGKYAIYTLADYIDDKRLGCLSGDSRVLRRKVIEAFPPLKYSYDEDVFLFIRSFYLGSVLYLREPLVRYRQHADSIMGQRNAKKNTKKDIQYYIDTRVKQLSEDYLFAVQKGYINEYEAEGMQWKLDFLNESAKPQRKTMLWKIVHRLSKYSNKFFTKLLKAFE